MKTTRQIVEALTQTGISLQEAKQKIQNAMQTAIESIRPIIEKIVEALQSEKRDEIEHEKRKRGKRQEAFQDKRFQQDIKLKHFRRNYKPP